MIAIPSESGGGLKGFFHLSESVDSCHFFWECSMVCSPVLLPSTTVAPGLLSLDDFHLRYSMVLVAAVIIETSICAPGAARKPALFLVADHLSITGWYGCSRNHQNQYYRTEDCCSSWLLTDQPTGFCDNILCHEKTADSTLYALLGLNFFFSYYTIVHDAK